MAKMRVENKPRQAKVRGAGTSTDVAATPVSLDPILLVVGSSSRIAPDVSLAHSMLGGLPFDVMVVNNTGAIYTDPIKYVATWHPDDMEHFRENRAKVGGNMDFTVVTQFSHYEQFGAMHVGVTISGGSSALYAVLAGIQLGYSRVLIAGVDLRGEYAHFQKGWAKSYEAIKDKVRALSGYPNELLGPPSPEWLAGNK
jgi:hypothetical protein